MAWASARRQLTLSSGLSAFLPSGSASPVGDVQHDVAGVAELRRRVDLEVVVVEELAIVSALAVCIMSKSPDRSALVRLSIVDGDDELDLVEVRQVLAGDAVRAAPVVLVAHGPERVAVARRVRLELERTEPDRLWRRRRRPASPRARRRTPGSRSRCGMSGRLLSHFGENMYAARPWSTKYAGRATHGPPRRDRDVLARRLDAGRSADNAAPVSGRVLAGVDVELDGGGVERRAVVELDAVAEVHRPLACSRRCGRPSRRGTAPVSPSGSSANSGSLIASSRM